MSTLLFPGRHLVNTRFQLEYIREILGQRAATIPGLVQGRSIPASPVVNVVFAITSSNQENSRFNPIPFFIRAIGVDRFARELQASTSFHYRILGIPHYGHTKNFAAFTLKEVAAQSENVDLLTPENTVVLCSTPEVISLYTALGFSVATAELSVSPKPTQPVELVSAIAESNEQWADHALVSANLAHSSHSIFTDFPEVPRRIARIFRDPLTNQDGSLTAKRNYNTYARGMNEILRLKYLDIKPAIRAGRIVDEGCADGGLLAEISQDFPDSDLFGIDLSAEFAARFQERKRAGEFGNVYTCFYLRNLLDPVFERESIDTTICNSTLHELWSYAEQEKTVRAYLAMKFDQLRPGGRLVIRDVVGPTNADQMVLLVASTSDGASVPPADVPSDRPSDVLQRMSTHSRFRLFAHDFLHELRDQGRRRQDTQLNFVETEMGFQMSMRSAAEFLSKKDYTDNWRSEMNEEFCFWDYNQWRSALRTAGFNVLESEGGTATFGSRVYVNPWIVEHRYRGHSRLLRADEPTQEMDFPPTNMVLVAEKPRL